MKPASRWFTPSIVALACLAGQDAAVAQLGWADLHAHPASHLAFGHRDHPALCTADEGIFHGRPGIAFDPADPEATIHADLGACAPETHSACDATTGSLIQKRQRTQLINTLEDRFGTHVATGSPSFDGWPSANSRTHQQMHLKWLHRAWQGGMRLMIASITDNELLSKYYHDDHNGPGIFAPERGYARMSAIRQINLLREIDAANSWFTIVHSAAEAGAAIGRGELAVVLGVELDNLSLDDLLNLIDAHGVRSVIPIHVVDNDLGGAAVEDDKFNLMNFWLNGKFLSVEGDPTTAFRLDQPQVLKEHFNFPVGYSIEPGPVDLPVWMALGYRCFPTATPGSCVADGVGHRNRLGLTNPAAIVELMRKGLLLDVVHMSSKAANDTIKLAETFHYPLIDSHTGMRDPSRPTSSERHLTPTQVTRIARLGGVIGLGTEGEPLKRMLVSSRGEPTVRLTGDAREWRVYPQADDRMPATDLVNRLLVRIGTGGDELRGSDGLACGSSTARLTLRLASGGVFMQDLNRGAGWKANSVHEVAWNLATTAGLGPQPVSNIKSFELRLLQGGGCISPDNWDVATLDIEYQGSAAGGGVAGGLLLKRSGVPYRRLTASVPAFNVTRATATPRLEAFRNATVRSLEFAFNTGEDDLGAALDVVLKLKDGREQRKNVRALDGFVGGFSRGAMALGTWNIAPVRYGDIESLYLVEHSSGSTLDWDNWSVKALKVVWNGCPAIGSCATPIRATLVDRQATELRGDPSFRATMEQPAITLWQGLSDFSSPLDLLGVLNAQVSTGGDDLRTGSNAELVLRLKDGTERSFPLNRGALWDNGTDKSQRPLFLRPAVEFGRVLSVGLRTDFGGGISGDNWNVDRLVVSNMQDPIVEWLQGFRQVHAAMSDRAQPAIALGTDLNGLITQMPFVQAGTARPGQVLAFLPEPFRIRSGDNTAGRNFTLAENGIAHVGLLPDFLNSVQSFGEPRTQIIFDSARAVVEAWRRAEIAGAAIPR
jgi:microsomal dipeptidase-like Zn-dependent dipeptidase